MKGLIYLIIPVVLSACGSTSDEYSLVIPPPEPTYKDNEVAERKYNIIYQTDAQGKPEYQETWTDVTVIGGENDSLASLTEFAKQKSKLQAVEEINGVLIKDKTKINSISVRNKENTYNLQDMQSESVSEALGIGKVKKHTCNSSLTQYNTVKLTCRILVEVPKIKQIDAI